jgi:hypothetical protein
MLTHAPLMPAKADIQFLAKALGPRFRALSRGRAQRQVDSAQLETALEGFPVVLNHSVMAGLVPAIHVFLAAA